MSAFSIIVGPAMVGKTVAACTFPKPMAFLDYDGNFSSIGTVKNPQGQPVVKEMEKIHRIDMTKTAITSLSFKTDLKAELAPAYTKSSLGIYKRYNDFIQTMDTKGGIEVAGQIIKVETLVIDSLTQMFQIWKECIMAMNNAPNPRMADYLTMEGQLVGAFFPTLKHLINTGKVSYILMTAHTQTDKDEETQKVEEFPIGPSKNMGRNLAKYVDDMLYMQNTGGKRVFRTNPVGFFKSSGSRHSIPDNTEATWDAVSKYLK